MTPGARELERRLQALLDQGFSETAARHVFETIALPPAPAIEKRFADLKALGFADPVKMVTTLPPILGYAIDNIRQKLAYGRRLGVDPVPVIEADPVLLGYALARLRFAARVAHDCHCRSLRPYVGWHPLRAARLADSAKSWRALRRYRPDLAAAAAHREAA